MNLEPRTISVSDANIYAAVETFLRQMKEIRDDSETVVNVYPSDITMNMYTVHIKPQEVQQPVDQTVH